MAIYVHTIRFILLEDTARMYTERASDVINAERAIMHVRRAEDPFHFLSCGISTREDRLGILRKFSGVIAFADTPVHSSNSLSARFPALLGVSFSFG